MNPILEAHDLKKRFGKTVALAGIDIELKPGRVVALLGPNGAGKTTFVRAVATLLRPDTGTLHVAGIDVVRRPALVRQIIGLAGQFAAVELAMSGRENLEMVGRLFGLSRRDAKVAAVKILDQLQLADVADRMVRTYSGGMRRRIDLGISLVGAPRLLLLDEPSTGLDPASRIHLWDAIRGLVVTGTDILLTTQYLDEADRLASDIVIIDHGRVIASGSPGELKTLAGDDVIEVHVRHEGQLPRIAEVLTKIGSDLQIDRATHRISASVDDGSSRLMEALRAFDQQGITVEDISLRRPTLDEVFLTLTGKPAQNTRALERPHNG